MIKYSNFFFKFLFKFSGTPEACDAVCSARPCAALQLEELGGMHRWVCHGAPLPLPAAGASRDDVSGEGPPLLVEFFVSRKKRVLI
jgi:hypothetical protein